MYCRHCFVLVELRRYAVTLQHMAGTAAAPCQLGIRRGVPGLLGGQCGVTRTPCESARRGVQCCCGAMSVPKSTSKWLLQLLRSSMAAPKC